MLTKQKIKEILSKRVEQISALEIPHFSLLSDIQKATKRVVEAIDNNQKIVIVGDYDVDGVVSSAIMKLFFEKIGYEIEVVIPNRFSDGYGFSVNLLDRIEADLIITVDNGIGSFEAVEVAKSRGIDVIITDHHTPFDELPNAYAIVNPKTSPSFPFKEICGAEVAWYLCASIKHYMKLDIDLREYLDILAIAIIADVMPLTHMNRVLVKMGLKRLQLSNKPFALAIKDFFPYAVFDSEFIAFQIAPRINAAGRMESADVAYKFLISKDFEEARELFLELDRLNNLRKEEENRILENIEISDEDFIVAHGDFHEGVIGIVASRLVNRYKKPAIVFTKSEGGFKGSGRSLGNIDIFELINKSSDILDKFGGHKLACGLSLKEEYLEKLKENLNRDIKCYNKEDFFIKEHILGEIPFSEIDEELMEILEEFEPYGEGNPKPKFLADVKIEYVENIKDNHYKLILSQNGIFFRGVIFRYNKEISTKEAKIKFFIGRFNSDIQLIVEEIL